MKKLLSVAVASVVLAVALCAHVILNDAGDAVVQAVPLVSAQAVTTPDSTETRVPPQPTPTRDVVVSEAHRETYTGRWGIDRIGVPAAWDAASFNSVLVAVLDTGIASDAPFAHKVVGGIDFTGSSTFLEDENGHGTHMAGTIAAIAPNAEFLSIKVADRRGRCDSETVARGIRWAVARGAQVINVSLEVAPSPELESAIACAWENGAVIVAAAGNGGTSEPAYPAAYTAAIAVAGTNQNDALAVLSNYGDWVDIAAPGFKIEAEIPGGDMGFETGTSPAAAHVSGVAALLFGVATDGTGDGFVNDDVRIAIESSAEPLAISGIGNGLVHASAAVLAISR